MKIENARIVGVSGGAREMGRGVMYECYTTQTVELQLLTPITRHGVLTHGLSELRCTLIVHEPDPSPGEQLRAAHLARAKEVGEAVTHPRLAWHELNAAARAVWEADAAFVPAQRKSPGQIAHERFHEVMGDLGPSGWVPYRKGWAQLPAERKAAWEAAAAAAVEDFCR